MSVIRRIVVILAALAIGAIWWITAGAIDAAPDALALSAVVLKGAFGLVSTFLIASLLLRRDL